MISPISWSSRSIRAKASLDMALFVYSYDILSATCRHRSRDRARRYESSAEAAAVVSGGEGTQRISSRKRSHIAGRLLRRAPLRATALQSARRRLPSSSPTAPGSSPTVKKTRPWARAACGRRRRPKASKCARRWQMERLRSPSTRSSSPCSSPTTSASRSVPTSKTSRRWCMWLLLLPLPPCPCRPGETMPALGVPGRCSCESSAAKKEASSRRASWCMGVHVIHTYIHVIEL